MKKTWPALCLAGLLTFGLAACGGDKTGSNMTQVSPSPSQTVSPAVDEMDRDGNGNPGDDDLAGADGMVGDDTLNGDMIGGVNGTGNTGDGYDDGRADDSALENVGEGIQDTLDDIGSAARGMGRDAKNALER